MYIYASSNLLFQSAWCAADLLTSSPDIAKKLGPIFCKVLQNDVQNIWSVLLRVEILYRSEWANNYSKENATVSSNCLLTLNREVPLTSQLGA